MSESVSVDTDTDTEPSESDLSDKDNAELHSAPSDTLLKGLKNDEDQDTRSCPHDCHGNLSVVERESEELVICQSCRCTPDGVFYEPDERHTTTSAVDGQCAQYNFFNPEEPQSPAFDPRGSEWDSQLEWRSSGERRRYRNSNKVQMVGGFDETYPQEMTSRDDSII